VVGALHGALCAVAILAQPPSPTTGKPIEIQHQVAFTCAISGTVRDAAGAVVPGAAIRIINSATGATQALTADNAGRYCAHGLGQGKYSVVIDKAGFYSMRLDAVTIAPNGGAQTDAVLKRGVNVPLIVESAHRPTPPPPPSPPSPAHGVNRGPASVPRPVTPGPVQPSPVQGDQGSGSGSGAAESLGEAEAKWFDQLKNGAITYNVPPEMVIGQGYEVSVVVYGYKAPAPGPQAGGSTPAPLKVSDFMRVEISQDDNPDEFTIIHGDNPDQQFVPINSNTTWKWTVTPKHLGTGQKLQFQASVVYSDPKLGVQRAFPSTAKVVAVRTGGVKGIVDDARDNFWLQPLNWFKYMLPGGAGFAAIIALIGWWQKRRKKPEAEKTGEVK